jgi:hypothetical protein
MRRRHVGLLVSAAIAAHGVAAGSDPVPLGPVGRALPEGDPADFGTPRQPLNSNGLDMTVARAWGPPFGTPNGTDLLTPAFTPTTALETRNAFPDLLWKPALGPTGQPVISGFTMLSAEATNR